MKNEKYLEVFNKIVALHKEGKLVEKIDDLEVEDIDKDLLKGYAALALGQEIEEGISLSDIAKKALSEKDITGPALGTAGKCKECFDKNDNILKCVCSCPFDAIFADRAKGKIVIDGNKCVGCGECMNACDNNKIMDKIQYMPITSLINEGTPVYVSIAPAYVGQYGENVTPGKLRTAFKSLGFKDMIETAVFADIISIKEAVEFDNLVKTEDDFMITSCCCPIWMGMLKKQYKDLLGHLTPSVSPMIASGRVIKKIAPGAKVVFVGPCIAKKAEAREIDIAGAIDYVMTFDELNEIFKAAEIKLSELEEDNANDYASKGGRIYARSGGVSQCIQETVNKVAPNKSVELKAAHVSGVKDCKAMLDKASLKQLDANFLEGMGCAGGCVGGPKAIIHREAGREMVNKYGDEAEYKTPIDSPCVLKVLQSIDINSIDELLEDNEKSKLFLRESLR